MIKSAFGRKEKPVLLFVDYFCITPSIFLRIFIFAPFLEDIWLLVMNHEHRTTRCLSTRAYSSYQNIVHRFLRVTLQIPKHNHSVTYCHLRKP